MRTGRFTRTFVSTFWLPMVLCVGGANAGPAKLSREEMARQQIDLKNLLGAAEKTPLCPDWQKFDEKIAVEVISKTLVNAHEAAPVRARAAFALGCFKNPQAGKALETVIGDEKTTNLVRGPALVALADSQKGGAVRHIEKALKSKDPSFRLAAVDAAKKVGTKQAHDVLRAHLKVEQFPLIQAQIRQVIEPGAK